MPPLLARRNSRTIPPSSLSIFKSYSHILSLWDLFPSAPNVKETLIVVIKQGGTAEAAISNVIKTINSIISTILFLVIKWSS